MQQSIDIACRQQTHRSGVRGRVPGHRAVSWTLRIIKDKSNVRF